MNVMLNGILLLSHLSLHVHKKRHDKAVECYLIKEGRGVQLKYHAGERQ